MGHSGKNTPDEEVRIAALAALGAGKQLTPRALYAAVKAARPKMTISQSMFDSNMKVLRKKGHITLVGGKYKV